VTLGLPHYTGLGRRSIVDITEANNASDLSPTAMETRTPCRNFQRGLDMIWRADWVPSMRRALCTHSRKRKGSTESKR
jgi:hypothetical protein